MGRELNLGGKALQQAQTFCLSGEGMGGSYSFSFFVTVKILWTDCTY